MNETEYLGSHFTLVYAFRNLWIEIMSFRYFFMELAIQPSILIFFYGINNTTFNIYAWGVLANKCL